MKVMKSKNVNIISQAADSGQNTSLSNESKNIIGKIAEQKSSRKQHTTDNLWLLRLFLFFLLAAVIATIGSASFLLLRQIEIREFDNVFKSSVNHISENINIKLNKKFSAAKAVNDIFAYAINDGYIGNSPNLTLPGFEAIMTSIVDLAELRAINFNPLLTTETRHGWEAYAKSHWRELEGPPIVEEIVEKGLYVLNDANEIIPVPEVIPWSIFPNISTPIWQIAPIYDNTGAIMYDPHAHKYGTDVVDRAILTKEGVFTDILQLVQDTHGIRPSTILFSPVMTLNTTVIGISAAVFSWNDLLESILSSDIEGIICVLSTTTQTYTFEFSKGEVIVLGEGDVHSKGWEAYKSVITKSLTALSSRGVSDYTLTLYPTNKLYIKYITDTPFSVCISFVAIIVFTAVVVMCYDVYVTNREKSLLQEAVNMKMRELEMKSSFVRYISHEVRTPLNIVALGLKYLNTELIEKDVHSDELDEVLHDLEIANDSAVDILDNLLTYEKLSSNVLQLDMSVVLFEQYVRDCVRLTTLQAKESNVQVSINISNNFIDHSVQLDKRKISHVIRNLLSNAIKFSSTGGEVIVKISIERNSEEQTFGRVEVIDNGPGISQENQLRLFKDIVQFNPGELQDGKGSGLGLWISHQIITLHKGKLYVNSQGRGYGSTFTIELPILQDTVVPDIEFNDNESVSFSEVRSGNPTVDNNNNNHHHHHHHHRGEEIRMSLSGAQYVDLNPETLAGFAAQDMSRKERLRFVFRLIAHRKWEKLLEYDELIQELKAGRVLEGFNALTPCFPPTFKRKKQLCLLMESGGTRLSTRDVRKYYSARRIPAFCDRILYKSLPGFIKNMEIVEFISLEGVDSSDHKPVRAEFRICTCPRLQTVPKSKDLNIRLSHTFHRTIARTASGMSMYSGGHSDTSSPPPPLAYMMRIHKLQATDLDTVQSSVFTRDKDLYVQIDATPLQLIETISEKERRTRSVIDRQDPGWFDAITCKLRSNDLYQIRNTSHIIISVRWKTKPFLGRKQKGLIGSCVLSMEEIIESPINEIHIYKFRKPLILYGIKVGYIAGQTEVYRKDRPVVSRLASINASRFLSSPASHRRNRKTCVIS